MSFVTNNEEKYFNDVPFADSLENYAIAKQIRLGNFQKCTELHHFDGSSS